MGFLGSQHNQAPHSQALGALAFQGLGPTLESLNGAGLGRNTVLNPEWRGNCRGIPASTTLTVDEAGHDLWVAGSFGCTFSLTFDILTITAGSYICGAKAVVSGVHTIGHDGTAPLRVNGGPWVTGADQAVNVIAGNSITLEFGIGSVIHPSIEPGTVRTPYVSVPPILERRLLDWYVQRVKLVRGGSNAQQWASAFGSTYAGRRVPLAPMASGPVPVTTLIGNTNVQYYTYAGVWTASTLTAVATGSASELELEASVAAAGDGRGILVRCTNAGDVVAVVSVGG